MRHLLVLSLLIGVLASCGVQKRKYLSGYYYNRSASVKSKPEISRKNFYTLQKTESVFCSFKKDVDLTTNTAILNKPATIKETICDTLFMSNGVKMIVKVSDVDKEKIHYYLCDSENQAEFYIETVKIKKICYANGLIDELKNPKDAPHDYSAAQNHYNQRSAQKDPFLEDARRKANSSLVLVLGGLFFFPVMIAGFIMAHNAKKTLKGKAGYESSYRLANTLSIIGYALLGFIVFIICLAIIA